jgi:sugar lactone lactonase YvrE
VRIQRIMGISTLRRAFPALVVAALAVAGPAASGQAAAAPHGSAATAPVISTVAGGVGGPAKATTVHLPPPCGLAYRGGNLYSGDTGALRQLNTNTDQLTTLAGTEAAGPLKIGGLAASSSLDVGCGVTTDPAGNVVISDFEPSVRFPATGAVVLVVAAKTGTFYGQAMTAGHIYKVVGGGTGGLGGPATSYSLGGSPPPELTVDAAGNLVIADGRVLVVAAKTGTSYGQTMTAGHIYSVAGGGDSSANGIPATQAELTAQAVAQDVAGNLVLADDEFSRIRVVAESTGKFYGQAMTAGDIYTIAGTGIAGFSGDGGPARQAQLDDPRAFALDGAGNVVVADNDRIRVIAAKTGSFYGQAMTARDIYTVAGNGTVGFSGDGGPATDAALGGPDGVAVDGNGNIAVAAGSVFRIRVIAATTGTFYGQAMTAADIYTVAGNGPFPFSGDGGPATAAQFNQPNAAAVDGAGNLVIADTDNNRIRVVAARTGTFYGQAMTAGDVYTIAGTGHRGFSGDGGPGTKAKLFWPSGVAVDSAGNVLIADIHNNRIRVVAGQTGTFYGRAMTAGDIYTIVGTGAAGFSGDGGPATSAQLDRPNSVTVDPAGNLLIADTRNVRVRVVAETTGTLYGRKMTAGDIYTVAGGGQLGLADGGPATQAHVVPDFVTVDHAGNLVIADSGDLRIRVVAEITGTFYGQAMKAKDIYTVAGGGSTGGLGGPATQALLDDPEGVAVDGAGNVVIAEGGKAHIRGHNTGTGRILAVPVSTGTFYGQPMTAGNIYAIVGNGLKGFSGDGGPARRAELFNSDSVVVTGAGDLVIADSGNNRIRSVTG